MEEPKAQAIQTPLNLGGPLEAICFQRVFVLVWFFFSFSPNRKKNVLIMEETERVLSFDNTVIFLVCFVRASVLLLSLLQPLSCGQISL